MTPMQQQKQKLHKDESFPKSVGPLEALTEEIISKVLDCLSAHPAALKSFSLACKSFYFVESHHRRSLKPLGTELLSRAYRRYPLITHLDLKSCPRVDDESLSLVASAYRASLLSIDLSKSGFFTGSGLSNLVSHCSSLIEIDVSNCTDLRDSDAAVVAKATNLERLWLARCKMVSDIGVGCIAVGCQRLRLICLKWCLRVSDLGVGLIAMKCKQLRTLDLSYLPITEKCFPQILQLQHLNELILVGCPGIDDNGLVTLQTGYSSLEALNLSNSQNISHIGVSSLTRNFLSLHQLNLAYGLALTTDLAKCLNNFANLQVVKLDGCSVTCSGMKAVANWRASLKELSLCKCSGVTDDGLSSIVQKHHALRKLDITCCRKISSVSLESITSYCTSLMSLKMESCSLVPKEAFLLIGKLCQFLEELDVTDNDISDEGLRSISRCSKLTSLKLGLCSNITDNGLSEIAKHCARLREVDLYRCTAITDVGIAAIATGCVTLETINIAYCEKMTDSSLSMLSDCSLLKELEIRGCPRITADGLSAIAVGCRELTVLDIKKCPAVNDRGILSLAQYSENLKQINLSYCSVTDIGLLSLASIKRLQNMTILHVAGLTPNGLATVLLACRGLAKVKLHTSFRALLSKSLFDHMEARGCVFHWRNKLFEL